MCSFDKKPRKRPRYEDADVKSLNEANLGKLREDIFGLKQPSPLLSWRGNSSCGISSERNTGTSPDETSSTTEADTDSASETSSVDYQSQIFGCWKATSKLSSGNNGQVYLGELLDVTPMNLNVALKVEKRSLKHSHLKTELRVIEKLRNDPGFPQVYDHGSLRRTLWMSMELLGPSLRSLHDKYRFDEHLTLFLALQMVDRMEALHSKGYVHMSVKPDNFCLQEDDQGEILVTMIDFGRCEKYIAGSGRHISYKNNKGGPFSRWYHSAGALKGKRQSRRDDMQSLAYCLVLFTVGDSFIDWREDLKDPTSVDVASCYRDKLPSWLYQFVRYCTDLEWEETPDYAGLRRLMTRRLTSAGIASAADLCHHAIQRHFRKLRC